MDKGEFHQLLQKYKAGFCSEEEIRKIDAWYSRISDEQLELSEAEKLEVQLRILSHIHPVSGSIEQPRKIRRPLFTAVKIAASLAGLVLVVYAIGRRPNPVSLMEMPLVSSVEDLLEHKNSTSGTLRMVLPDSSTVELKPGAEISYAKVWDDQKREVRLTGEAFFEVVKNPKRPFYVYGGNVVTKVLGTSFSVNAVKNATSIEVAVRTGKVSVYEYDNRSAANTVLQVEAGGVILTPNEKVEYFVENKHWVTSLVEEPLRLPVANDKAFDFIFTDTPMSKVIRHIEQSYAIDIIVENEASYSCTFTGDVSMMELYDMLSVICKSTGAEFEVKGTKILIIPGECDANKSK
jgi:transmembrane sensor